MPIYQNSASLNRYSFQSLVFSKNKHCQTHPLIVFKKDTVRILNFGTWSSKIFDQSKVPNHTYFVWSYWTSNSRKLLRYIQKILQLLICVREIILLVVFLVFLIKRLIGKLILRGILIRSLCNHLHLLWSLPEGVLRHLQGRPRTPWNVISCILAISHWTLDI